MGAIGLVVALNAEAKTLIGQGPWSHDNDCLFRRSRLTETHHLIVVRSGVGLDNASIACQWLIGQGVGALGIVGVAGGLAPELMPGDLVLANRVICEEAGHVRCVWKEHTAFVETARYAIKKEGLPVYRGPVMSVHGPVISSREKESLFGRSKALAVDMESAAVASAATQAHLPFFALRAICDPAGRSVPRDFIECLHPGGRIRLFPLLRRLASKPVLLFSLFQMKKDFGAALTALHRAWHGPIRGQAASLAC